MLFMVRTYINRLTVTERVLRKLTGPQWKTEPAGTWIKYLEQFHYQLTGIRSDGKGFATLNYLSEEEYYNPGIRSTVEDNARLSLDEYLYAES